MIVIFSIIALIMLACSIFIGTRPEKSKEKVSQTKWDMKRDAGEHIISGEMVVWREDGKIWATRLRQGDRVLITKKSDRYNGFAGWVTEVIANPEHDSEPKSKWSQRYSVMISAVDDEECYKRDELQRLPPNE